MVRNPFFLIIVGLFSCVALAEDPVNIPDANLKATIEASLVAYYSMDEGFGTMVADETGNGHDGTIQGGANWVQSMPGFDMALDFTNESYVDTGNWYPSRDGEPFSVLAWINVLDSWSASIGGWQGIVTQTTGQGVGNSVFQLALQNDRGLGVGGGTIPQCFYYFPPEGQWTHVAFSFDGDQATVYMNGQEIGTTDNYVVQTLDNANVRIGTSIINFSSWICPFNGVIDEVCIFNGALSQAEIQQVMEGISISEGQASSPYPEDEATDVLHDVLLSWTPGEYADTHNVYFSTNFNDVNNGIALIYGGLDVDANSFDPGILEYGQTYYWRIDEMNVPSNPGTYTGQIWQFTVEPAGYPLPSEKIIRVMVSSSFEDSDPNNTINESGLDDNDMHSTSGEEMWLSDGSGPGETWIQYAFYDVYKLHQMLVWNYNTDSFLYYFGFKDVNVEYSEDGQTWEALENVPQFEIAPRNDRYESNTIVDFNGVTTKDVKLTANSNWGTAMYNQYGLSEVRFLYIPTRAREPIPETDAINVPVDTILSWRPGREAAEHNLYLSLEEEAVINGTSNLYPINQAYFGPLLCELSQTYFWRVDEVNDNETPNTWNGDVWSFTTQDYLVVDDFESYSDEEPGRICDIWTDGRNNLTNGSIIGYIAEDQYLEPDIVHSDTYSAPIFYNNSTATYSEVTVNTNDLVIGKNWTKGAAETLVLWFYGDPGNSATDRMYVKINGEKVDYNGNPDDISRPIWKNWNINLNSLDINLSNVTNFTIGIEPSGGVGSSGVVFIDDIRLYRILPDASSDEIWIEAEMPYSLSSPMMAYEDPDASGGFYISVEPGYNSTDEPPAPYGVATYSITVTQGIYKISGRVITPTTDDDSFWLDISGATTNTLNHNSGWVQWNNIEQGSQWHWDDVHSSDDGDQMVEFFLEAGTHTMRIAYREDGAMLDAILITKID